MIVRVQVLVKVEAMVFLHVRQIQGKHRQSLKLAIIDGLRMRVSVYAVLLWCHVAARPSDLQRLVPLKHASVLLILEHVVARHPVEAFPRWICKLKRA